MATRSTKQQKADEFRTVQDLEVTGRLIGPQFSRIFAAIDALVAHNEIVTLGNSVLRGLDPIPTGRELFGLCQPDCVSSLGLRPNAKEIIYLPGYLRDEGGTEYANSLSKFSGLGAVGFSGACTNLIASPEDLTISPWTLTLASRLISDYYLSGRRFTKITAAGSSSGYVYQVITGLASTAAKGLLVTLRKGSAAASRFGVYDATAGSWAMIVTVTWATKTIAVTTGSGTIARTNWLGDDIVEVGVITASLTYTSTNRLCLFGGSVDLDYTYFTAAQVEDNAFPTWYTPTSRVASRLRYGIQVAATGTVEFWGYQFATYDWSTQRLFWCFGAGVDNSISLRYEASDDKYHARLRIDGSNYRETFSTAAITTNAALWAWHHFKVTWDIPNQTITLAVDGVDQTGTWSAGSVASLVPAAVFTPGMHGGLAYQARALITDLLYQPSVEDTSTTHYTKGVRWYDPTEVTNKYQTVRINRYGIRLHQAALGLTDDWNRSIEISPAAGLLAKDAAGTIIHDIPTAPLLVGAYPMGHLYLFKYDNAAYTLVDTSSPTTGSYVTQAALKLNNQSVNGVRLKIYVAGYDSSKAVPAFVWIMLRPSGSTWGYAMTDMAVADYSYISVGSGATFAYVRRGCELDVPVNADGEFDYYLELTPKITSLSLLIQQQGVWI